MSHIKHEFHEVIAGEFGAIEDLEAAYRAAYDTFFALHAALPVYRSRAQQAQLNEAESAMGRAKWKLDQARDWTRYHARNA